MFFDLELRYHCETCGMVFILFPVKVHEESDFGEESDFSDDNTCDRCGSDLIKGDVNIYNFNL